jgi:DNA-binding beta-propeller fold protein YncE
MRAGRPSASPGRTSRTRYAIAFAVAALATCAVVAVPAPALAAYRQTYLIENKWTATTADPDVQPYGIAFDSGDNLWLAGDGPYVARFAYTGSSVATFGAGNPDMFGSGRSLDEVRGVAIHDTSVWLCDYSNGIAKYTTSGTFAGALILSAATDLDLPEAVAVDPAGDVFVGDRGGAGTYGFRVSKFGPSGSYQHIHFGDTEGSGKYLTAVNGIAVASNDDVYVADGSHIRRYRPNAGQTAYTLNATWTNASLFGSPVGIAYDPYDNSVFVLDGSTMSVTKLDTSGNVLAHWTHGATGGNLDDPRGIAVALNGHVFVADNDGASVREFELQDLGPTTYAYASVSVKKGKTVKLEYEVKDDVSNACNVTIEIYKGSALKKTIVVGSVSQAAWHTKSWTCTLAKGTYKWKVYATDGTGHSQQNVASKTLTVK